MKTARVGKGSTVLAVGRSSERTVAGGAGPVGAVRPPTDPGL